ncbi:phenylacetaldoxime dehydratase [Melanomma pulvis-pyrius CBS 109.77]|uniref:Phenylacetaldoxime dehydratase n=1 Tax=Melanomma pulvis-pyrius CBS 109.77 TaxID=1314802 RepID=A0A6A6XTV4_9PLEO|nr:phenylacetaldoxime dehydratase [Melanomma pulvis-pyrius CBS 109.77]
MSTVNLDSAIPEHLRKDRTTPIKLSPNFVPPYASYASRFPESVKEIVMAIIGVQYCTPTYSSDTAVSKITKFLNTAPESMRPTFWEPAAVTDPTGAYNAAVIAYWPSAGKYEQWGEKSGFKSWWDGLDVKSEPHGWFLEVFTPTVDRWETVISAQDIKEGSSHMRDGISGDIKEHGYWGSMRDRLPIAQVDDLDGEKAESEKSEKGPDPLNARIRIPGKKNLAVIRSGQDWSGTSPEERKLYLETMHPVLIKGMEFLRDNPEIGCYSCRFMDVVDAETGKPDKERTFGLAYFNELASLEKWSKSHKTHLDIFGGFLKYAKKLGPDMTLKLWHEVLVLEPDQQYFEYIGCHGKTGMLGSL